MSGEEDTELRDLVSQTLENNGVLAKIRAELRANVFRAMEEHDSSRAKPDYQNRQLKEFLRTTEGALAASLVKEFLEFFHLEYTASVFEPESCCGTEFCPSSRVELIQQLCLQEQKDLAQTPVLSLVAQRALVAQTIVEPKEVIHPLESDHKVAPYVNGTSSAETKTGQELEEKPTVKNEVKAGSISSEMKTTENGAPSNSTFPIDTKVIEKSHLGVLPPLKKNGRAAPSDQSLPITDIASPVDSLNNNYEEDFQSSGSVSQGEAKGGGPPTSGSEIEEEVASEEPSSASVLGDELTLDASISLQTGVYADHLESV